MEVIVIALVTVLTYFVADAVIVLFKQDSDVTATVLLVFLMIMWFAVSYYLLIVLSAIWSTIGFLILILASVQAAKSKKDTKKEEPKG